MCVILTMEGDSEETIRSNGVLAPCYRFRLGTRSDFSTTLVIVLGVAMLPSFLGCNGAAGYDTKILESSEHMLQNGIVRAEEYPREGNQWFHEYLVPGEKRCLQFLQQVRDGGPQNPIMRSAALVMTREPKGRRGVFTVYFAHPPGHNTLKGVYFVTEDGEKHEFLAVEDQNSDKRATWLWHLYFVVEIDAYRTAPEDRMFFTKPIRVKGELVDTDELRVGLIMQDDQQSESVPVCVAYREKTSETNTPVGLPVNSDQPGTRD